MLTVPRHGGRSHPQDVAIAGTNELSPFSRTGPGVSATFQSGAIKPEFVHYGGNTVWSQMRRVNHTDSGAGVLDRSVADRLFAVSSGTSFAAPRVARAAAEILTRYPDASANLIRALLGISAQIPDEARRQFADEWEMHWAFGYGMPDPARAVESDLNRVVLVYEGDVDVNTAVIHPIPIPTPFATGKADRIVSPSHWPGTRRFAVNAASTPPVIWCSTSTAP